MLERLELRDVGPAASMRLDLAPRLNVIAGDNGLGKTFVLDVAWWAMTGTWAGYEAAPHRGEKVHPSIGYAIGPKEDWRHEVTSTFDFSDQRWTAVVPPPDAARR